MTSIKKSTNNRYWGEGREKGILINYGKGDWCTTMENSTEISLLSAYLVKNGNSN